MPLNKDLREFVELLNSNEVEYLVVGAFAVAYHGFPRYTADLDILLRPTPENAGRVLRALQSFGFGSVGVTAEDLQAEGKIIQLGVKPNRIDLLTAISGVTFEEAWHGREEGELEGIPSRFIGRAALLTNKKPPAGRKIRATRRSCAIGTRNPARRALRLCRLRTS